MVESNLVLQPKQSNCLKQPQRSNRVGVRGVLWNVETDMHVALRGEIIDFVGLGFLDQPNKVGGIRQITIMKEQPHR